MSPNEKFAWVATVLVTGVSLMICLAHGTWTAVVAAVLLMACFTAAARLERHGGSVNRHHWYYLIPPVLAPSICLVLDGHQALWAGIIISLAGGVATYILARFFPVITERQPEQQPAGR